MSYSTSNPENASVEIYTDSAGEHRWRFVAGNSKVIADSGEGYKNRADAVTALQQVIGARVSWQLAEENGHQLGYATRARNPDESGAFGVLSHLLVEVVAP